ncbi:MAG: YbhB/YbcL family Raf kinase inhibitor-like protein, partial [Desulfosporosinus sp.]
KSSKPGIVEVLEGEEGEGVTFHALAKGTATLTATFGGKKTTVSVKVTPEIVGIEAIPSGVGLTTGKQQAVKVYLDYNDDSKEDVTKSTLTTWESGDTEVATVIKGSVKGISMGDTTVTVCYNEEWYVDIPIKVTPAVLQIYADPNDPIEMIIGGDTEYVDPPLIFAQYKGDYEDEDVTEFTTWKSSKASIVEVVNGEEGVQFHALAKGTATLTATYGGKKTTVKINVPAPASMTLASSAFQNNAEIPLEYAYLDENISVPLSWTGVPVDTQSFALIMYDMDFEDTAHWAVINIPVDTLSLDEGASNISMPEGAVELENGFYEACYTGPFPPAGETHSYKFVVYALNTNDLNSDNAISSFKDFTDLVSGCILGKAELIGKFQGQ